MFGMKWSWQMDRMMVKREYGRYEPVTWRYGQLRRQWYLEGTYAS